MENITQDNILLAEFLGWGVYNYEVQIPFSFKNDQVRLLPEDGYFYRADTSDLCFDYDWNWLMKVVEKIETTELGDVKVDTGYSYPEEFLSASVAIEMEYYSCRIHLYGVMKKYANWLVFEGKNSKIQAAHEACVQFVKWFNKNKVE